EWGIERHGRGRRTSYLSMVIQWPADCWRDLEYAPAHECSARERRQLLSACEQSPRCCDQRRSHTDRDYNPIHCRRTAVAVSLSRLEHYILSAGRWRSAPELPVA